MTARVKGHLDWDALVDYWLGDTDAVASEAIDEHLLHCDACGAVFDEVVALSRGAREAFARGAVPAVLTSGFVDRLTSAGLRVRSYRVPRNGSVLCSVAPGDDLLVACVEASLAGVERLDALLALSVPQDHGQPPLASEKRLRDIPFDAAEGVVLFSPRLAEVRQLPTHELVIRLLAVDASGEREVGHYTFRHQAQAPA